METLQNIFQMEIIQRLGWTLVHFVWQAAAIALVLAIVLKLLQKSSANLRYIIACIALVLIVLIGAITFRMVDVSVGTIEPIKQAATDLPKAQAPVEMPQAESPSAQVAAMPRTSLKDKFIETVEPALPYVVIGWLVGVFGLSLWHLGGWTQLQRLRRQMVKQVAPALKAKLQQLSNMLGIQKTIGLVESALVQVPTVVGHLKPVILLPVSALTGLSSEQIEAILAHELAHIKRHDCLVNMLQTVVEILGFYHPTVWWISDKIRVERENCCDDIAISLCSNSLSYARALTTMEEIRFGQPALAVAASGGSLFDRIRRLLGKDSTNEMKLSRLPSAIAILLIMTLMISALLMPMACNQTRQTALETLPAGKIMDKIIVPGLRVGEYTFDISKDDVLESLGKPNHIFYEDKKYTLDNLPRTYYMLFDNVSFRILDDSVKEITAVSPYYKLANGLGVGDSEEKIKQTFGDDYHIKETEWKDFLTYEDKGLVFEINKNDRTVMEINVSPFESLKSHKKAHIPATSTINEHGHIVDKIDYPFVNDSQVIGTWKSVDFVNEIERFKVDEQQWKGRGGELFLHEMIFVKNGRLISKNDNVPRGYPGTWTKGLVFYDNDTVTASKYTIKEKDGSAYMFYEWKSGDYTFRHRKPSYYVLKKVSSETGGLAETWASQPSDPEFAGQLPAKIEELDIDTADLEKVKEIFGEPAQYIWGKESFTEDNLPGRYILVYPSSFHIFMSDNKIVEIRHEHGFNYVFRDKIRSGSTLDEVFDVIGSPEKTVEGEENKFKDGVLYKDIDGRKGHCYYARSDQNVRLWFWEYKIIAIYMTRSDYGSGAAPRKGLLGLRLDEKRWPVVDIIPEMPAEQAGMQNGDKILTVNDKDITHITTIRGALKVLRGDPGQKVKLTVERDGQLLDFQVERAKARDNDSADKSQNEIRQEKIIEARSNPQIIHKAAYDLFEKIKNADYDYFLSVDWEQFPLVEYYNSYRDYPELVRWICTTFKENPIVSIELGDVSFSENWPRIYYKLILKDGAILEGDLRFEYHFYHGHEGRWHGIHGHFYDGPQTSYKMHGLDWHLQKIK